MSSSLLNPAEIDVRLGAKDDIDLLRQVEASASSIFNTITSLAHHASDDGLSTQALTHFIAAKQLWVATIARNSNNPVGFLVAHPLSKSTTASYIAELSVSAAHQRMGVGEKLIEAFCADAAENGVKDVLLTTYRDVSWNGPWYQKRGFVIIEDGEWENEEWSEALKKIVAGERGERGARNFAGGVRCVMKRAL